MSILLILLSVALLASVAWTYHKVTTAIHQSRLEVKQAIENATRQNESLLSVYAELGTTRGLPRTRGWAASPDFLAYLVSWCQMHRPQAVLECSSGLSTVVLASCMRNMGQGRVISLEHDPVYAVQTRKLLELHGLSQWATVVDAPLVATVAGQQWKGKWYDTAGLPADLRADLIVVDGPPNATGPMARFPALPNLTPWMSATVTLALDDADRPEEKATVARWLSEAPGFSQILTVPECEKGCAVLARGQG